MNAPIPYQGQQDHVEEAEASLKDYLDIISRRRKPFWLTFAVIFTVALGLAFALPPVYRSEATILIEQQEIPKELVQSTITSFADQRVQVIRHRVMTTANLWDIVEKYDLFPEVRDIVPQEKIIDRMEKSIHVEMISADVIDPRSGRPSQANIAFKVAFDYGDPRTAQRVANELTSLFLKENLQDRTKAAEETTAFLEEEAGKLEAQIADLEDRLADFKEENLGMLPEQMKVNMTVLDRTEREIMEIDRQLQDIRERNIILQGQLATVKPYIEEDRTVLRTEKGERVLSTEGRLHVLRSRYVALLAKYSPSHPNVVRVRKEIEALGADPDNMVSNPLLMDNLALAEEELAKARKKYSPDHPAVKRLEAKVRRLREKVGTLKGPDFTSDSFEVKRIDNPAYVQLVTQIRSSQAEADSLRAKRALLERKIQEYEKRLENAPRVERQYRELVREHENAVEKYKEIKAKLLSARMAQSLETEQKGERFSLIEPPLTPTGPIKPNRLAILLLGTILALGAAFGLVMLLESFDSTINSRQALAKVAGAEPFSVIPFIISRSEAEEKLHRARVIRWSIVGGVVAAMGAILLVHLFVMPLDVLWFRAMRELRILFF